MYTNNRFHQILKALPRAQVNRISEQFNADRYGKSFKPYDHLISLIYAQLSGVNSLRELQTSFNAHREQHYHLGTQAIKRSTLSDANQRRNPKLFKCLLEQLMVYTHRQQRRQLKSLVYLLD